MTAAEQAAPAALSAPREIGFATIRLALAQAVWSATIPLNATLGSIAAVHLSHDQRMSGSSVGAAMLSSVLALTVAGRLADQHGRRPVLIAGFSLIALGSLTVGLSIAAGSFPLFVLGTIIFGLGSGPAAMTRAAAADLYPASLRGSGVGRVATAGAIGSVAGPLIAAGVSALAALTALDANAAPWLAAPFLCLLAIGTLRRLQPDPRDVADDLERWYPGNGEARPSAPPRRRLALVRQPQAWRAIAAAAAVQAAMVGVMGITGVVLDDAGASHVVIALLMSAHFIGMFAFAVPLGRLGDRVGRTPAILLGLAGCALGALTTTLLVHSFWVVPAFVLLGAGWSIAYIAVTARLADLTQAHERSTLIATNDLLVALSAGVAVLLAGPLLNAAGFGAVGLAACVLCAAAAAPYALGRTPSG